MESGTIHVLVGPNGSGKTTLLEIIEGLRPYDSGIVEVLGQRINGRNYQLFRRVGVQLQESGLRSRLKVREEIELVRDIYNVRIDMESLAEAFGLRAQLHQYCADLSGGQKRRLLLLLASMHQPDLLILDEPTSGLDAQARHNTWAFIQSFAQQGKTVFMTVHNLDEAEKYADTITLIHRGRTVVEGRPEEIVKSANRTNVCSFPVQYKSILETGDYDYAVSREKAMVYCKGQQELNGLLNVLRENGVGEREIGITPFTLEDLYLKTTGYEYQ